MLHLKKTIPDTRCNIGIDYYVPFTIQVPQESLYGPKIHWRTGNLKCSLIEIAIDEQSGLLNEITLTSVDNCHLSDMKFQKTDILECGVPVFEINGIIKNGLCDEPKDIFVFLGSDYITAQFGEKNCCKKMVQFDRVYLGFDSSSNLVSVSIIQLSDDEYAELTDSLKCIN